MQGRCDWAANGHSFWAGGRQGCGQRHRISHLLQFIAINKVIMCTNYYRSYNSKPVLILQMIEKTSNQTILYSLRTSPNLPPQQPPAQSHTPHVLTSLHPQLHPFLPEIPSIPSSGELQKGHHLTSPHLSSPSQTRKAGWMQWSTLGCQHNRFWSLGDCSSSLSSCSRWCLQGRLKCSHQSWTFGVQSKCSGMYLHLKFNGVSIYSGQLQLCNCKLPFQFTYT